MEIVDGDFGIFGEGGEGYRQAQAIEWRRE